jgi:hypothetical protein
MGNHSKQFVPKFRPSAENQTRSRSSKRLACLRGCLGNQRHSGYGEIMSAILFIEHGCPIKGCDLEKQG